MQPMRLDAEVISFLEKAYCPCWQLVSMLTCRAVVNVVASTVVFSRFVLVCAPEEALCMKCASLCYCH